MNSHVNPTTCVNIRELMSKDSTVAEGRESALHTFNFVTTYFWYEMSVSLTLCTRCVRLSRSRCRIFVYGICDSLFEMREFFLCEMNVIYVVNCGFSVWDVWFFILLAKVFVSKCMILYLKCVILDMNCVDLCVKCLIHCIRSMLFYTVFVSFYSKCVTLAATCVYFYMKRMILCFRRVALYLRRVTHNISMTHGH